MQASWLWGLGGGLLIGLSAAIYLLGNGRIMGASGIIGGLVDGSDRAGRAERASFLAGLVGLPAVLTLFTTLPPTHLTHDLAVILIGGFAVGLGARVANGCTSGHGVCGMSRLSWRSIAATVTFLLSGALTMFVARHLLGWI